MANEYSINAKITADSSDFQKAVKDASKSLEGMKDAFGKATQNIKRSCADWGLDIDRFYNKGSQIFKDFGIDIDKFASHFGTSGKVVAAITAATVALTKFGQAMNEARGELAKGTGAVGEDLIKLQDTFHKAMIEGIGRDAKEVGGMMADLNTRFGATEKELVDMTVQFDKFSAVMGVDTRQAINDTADVMAKWGIETKNLNPLLDQLTTASQMSGATIDELTSGLKQGQSVFSQFGMSATDSIAILSSLAKNGIETNSAITALKYSLNVFSKAGVDAKTGLNDTIEAITNAKTETEALSVACEVFGARNGVEMVKVLKSGSMSADEFKTALMNAGGALNATDKASRTSIDAISDLKATLTGTFAGFGEGFDSLFKDIIDSVSEVVRFLSPVIEPIGNIFRDVFSAIGEMLKVLVDNFIEFQKKYNDVFKAVAVTVQSAYKVIHSVLGNILEVFKTGFSLIFAILDGKWGLAWENAKKLALLFAKNLSDILSGIVNLFAKMINGVIEKLNSAIDLYHKLPKVAQIFDISNIGKISESNNLADSWGITSLLEETEKRIEELSGKAAEKITGDLGEVKEVSADVSDSMVTEAMEVSQISIDWSNKLLQQEIAVLEKEREDAVAKAQLEKKTEREIFDIKKSYEDKIYALQVKQIEAQRKAEIKKVKDSKKSLESQEKLVSQINKYYDTQITLIKKSSVFIEKTDKAVKESSNAWNAWIKSFEDKANDWTTMTVDMAKVGMDSMGDMFKMMGENLAGAGHGYEDFAATAIQALAQILQTLASQITALGVVNALMGNYANAAIAAAGAAAALVAAGVATAVASNMKKTSDSVKDVGDAAEKSDGQLEEFMKKLEQIKEGTYGQEAGLTWMGMKKLEAETSEIQKYIDYWANQSNYWADHWNQYMYENTSAKFFEYKKKLEIVLDKYNSAVSEAIQTQRDLTISNYETASSYKYLYDMTSQFYRDENIMSKAGQFKRLLTESLSADISKLVKDAWTSLSSIGKDLGEQFFSSIEEGADSANFLINMKKIIRNNMLKIAVYTQSFNDKMAEIGTKLVSAISGGPKWLLGEAKYELEELYESTLATTKSIDSLLDNVFGKTSESADNATNSIDTATNSLTKFEEAMNSVLDSIQDLGGDIASNLVDALSNGLTQSDFLGNMKTWLRNMMIQMVVYTDTMKAEVEEIGKRISEGLTSGFTDTSLHEIRRDLSYIFEQTSSKMANLDTILGSVFSGYATGTENASRGLHLVGEAGPELVQFKGGERVFNNRDTMSMMSGGSPSNNFNVTFNNLQDTSAFAMMSQLKQYQREMAFNAVI